MAAKLTNKASMLNVVKTRLLTIPLPNPTKSAFSPVFYSSVQTILTQGVSSVQNGFPPDICIADFFLILSKNDSEIVLM